MNGQSESKVMALSQQTAIKNKAELIRRIQRIGNAAIEAYDINNDADKTVVSKRINELSRRKDVSVILVVS